MPEIGTHVKLRLFSGRALRLPARQWCKNMRIYQAQAKIIVAPLRTRMGLDAYFAAFRQCSNIQI